MVRRIERFRPELQLNALRERERAVNAQVRFEETRATQAVPADGSKARARLRRPRTIGRAVDSKHGIVEPWSTTCPALRRGTYSLRNKYRRVELIRNLLAPTGEQIRRIALNNIERQSAHDAHHTAHLETTKDRTGPTLTSHSLALSKRQIVNAVHLQVVLPVTSGWSAVPLFRRQERNPRALIIVSIVDRLGPRVGCPE